MCCTSGVHETHTVVPYNGVYVFIMLIIIILLVSSNNIIFNNSIIYSLQYIGIPVSNVRLNVIITLFFLLFTYYKCTYIRAYMVGRYQYNIIIYRICTIIIPSFFFFQKRCMYDIETFIRESLIACG